MPFAKSTPAPAGCRVRSLVFSLLALTGLGSSGLAHAADQTPAAGTHVQTLHGPVQGRREAALVVFKGVPYAAAPVGNNRWRAPQPLGAWTGIRDAGRFGPACPSIDGRRIAEGRWLKDGGTDLFVDVPLAAGSSEDCLHLNIWAPADASKAPVMVWLQPTGSSSSPLFDGSSFARDSVVFVTLDYRQLTLGNFAHPALTAEAGRDTPLARYQTMDQLAALRWVKQNIAAFGGDADNVTLFGESAGAASVLQLLSMPAARGLIDKAIVQSGVGWWTPFSLQQMERLGIALASRAGLPGKDATVQQLRELPPGALAQTGVYSVDGRLERENGTARIDKGRLADVPLMIGWNDFDGSSLRNGSPEGVAKAASAELLAAYAGDQLTGAELGYQLHTDGHVGAPARWIARKAARGAPSYLYLYSYVLSLQRGKARGAAHGSEIPFVFDAWDKALPQLPLSAEDRTATRLMHSCWVSFARTGKPACDGAPEWPAYTSGSDQLMELGTSARVRQNFRKTQLDAQERAWRKGRRQAELEVEAALRRLEEVLLADAKARP
jgi:para-nitrobenzyl esterase